MERACPQHTSSKVVDGSRNRRDPPSPPRASVCIRIRCVCVCIGGVRKSGRTRKENDRECRWRDAALQVGQWTKWPPTCVTIIRGRTPGASARPDYIRDKWHILFIVYADRARACVHAGARQVNVNRRRGVWPSRAGTWPHVPAFTIFRARASMYHGLSITYAGRDGRERASSSSLSGRLEHVGGT